MQRIASVVQIRDAAIDEYERIHADTWPGVLATIAACNIRNYSIYRYRHLLFSNMEYHGTDYEADMERMAADPVTREWWAITNPMLQPVPDAPDGAFDRPIPEVFHTD